MADNCTMAQMLQAPTEGYEDAIVIPEINANFELKHGLINLVQNKQFFGHDKEDPHAHNRYFNKITSTMRFSDVPSTSIKLMLFPFSLEGSARIWLEKEPPRSIFTWDDLVSKFINQLFPPSKMTNLHSLNSAAGGSFLNKMPRECLRIIESKSKVRNSRNKAVVAKVSSNSSTPGISPDVAALTTEVSELKNLMKTMLIDKQKAQAPATVKAVEQSCVTCGGAHSYKNCPATDGNVYQDNIQEYVSQAAAANFNQGNSNSRPSMVSNQIRPPGFPPIQNNQNRFNPNQGNNFNQNRGTNFNQNRGSNFNQGQVYQPPTIQPPVYQAPPRQMQGVSKTDLWKRKELNANIQTTHVVEENSFQIESGMDCLGALDGTYVKVMVPESEQKPYRTRKGVICTNLLGVCTRDLQFIYVLAGWEGSAADSRVLRDAFSRPNGLKVTHGNYYLCDVGYTNSEGLLTPYRGQRYHLNDWSHPPTTSKEFYNMRHSSARNCIERCFGLIKARWAILPDVSYHPLDSMPRIIIACTDKSKSQENSQKRANTDTRIRRVQKEAKDPKP
ncbi:reverse transcriptase domain-containing protein [Tanacetum coccineum]